jgi:hypothetical protein
MKKVNVGIEKKLHSELKKVLSLDGTKVYRAVEEAIKALIAKKKKEGAR